MTQVFRIYSRLKAPVDAVRTAIEEDEVTLPEGIDDVDIDTVNGKLKLTAVPSDESVGRYTPAAEIKASLTESYVVVEDDGTVTHESVSKYQQGSGWKGMTGEDETHNTREIEYADFYGRGDEVIVHELLRSEMFEVLCQLAPVCISGYVQAIMLEDGELESVWYDAGGELVDAEININRAETPSDEYTTDEENELTWSP